MNIIFVSLSEVGHRLGDTVGLFLCMKLPSLHKVPSR